MTILFLIKIILAISQSLAGTDQAVLIVESEVSNYLSLH